MSEYNHSEWQTQPSPTGLAIWVRHRLQEFVAPLVNELDAHIDKRLVRTFCQTLETLLAFGNQVQGLLLSELGAYLLSPQKAPAGTKRLSNLLRSDKWAPSLIETFLWKKAQERQQELADAAEDALALWDGSVIEKPESRQAEALCPVRSQKAKRLTRNRPGFGGGPPGKPAFVPGFSWLALLIAGRQGPPTLAAMRWFSKRGQAPTTEREALRPLLERCVSCWGEQVVHIFDRGFAGAPFLEEIAELSQRTGKTIRLIVRWPKRYKLCNSQREKVAAWQVTRGKRSWEEGILKDGHTGKDFQAGILAMPVTHPDLPDLKLSLVVCRPHQNREPWYLLTNEPVPDAQAAWKVVFAYARRWQIEMAFRYNKSELAVESPRLWTLERRTKLMLMLSVLYAFLLSLLDNALVLLRLQLLNQYCKRTGERSRLAQAPLYRLRWAICRLLSQVKYAELALAQNPG